jgi:hypothetical protein
MSCASFRLAGGLRSRIFLLAVCAVTSLLLWRVLQSSSRSRRSIPAAGVSASGASALRPVVVLGKAASSATAGGTAVAVVAVAGDEDADASQGGNGNNNHNAAASSEANMDSRAPAAGESTPPCDFVEVSLEQAGDVGHFQSTYIKSATRPVIIRGGGSAGLTAWRERHHMGSLDDMVAAYGQAPISAVGQSGRSPFSTVAQFAACVRACVCFSRLWPL